MTTVPIAFDLNDSEMNLHLGGAAKASFVRRLPPPAAAAYKVQRSAPQPGSTASAVTRPDVTESAPAKLKTPGCRATPGPRSFQLPPLALLSRPLAWICANVRIAFWLAATAIASAG